MDRTARGRGGTARGGPRPPPSSSLSLSGPPRFDPGRRLCRGGGPGGGLGGGRGLGGKVWEVPALPSPARRAPAPRPRAPPPRRLGRPRLSLLPAPRDPRAAVGQRQKPAGEERRGAGDGPASHDSSQRGRGRLAARRRGGSPSDPGCGGVAHGARGARWACGPRGAQAWVAARPRLRRRRPGPHVTPRPRRSPTAKGPAPRGSHPLPCPPPSRVVPRTRPPARGKGVAGVHGPLVDSTERPLSRRRGTSEGPHGPRARWQTRVSIGGGTGLRRRALETEGAAASVAGPSWTHTGGADGGTVTAPRRCPALELEGKRVNRKEKSNRGDLY